MGFLALSGAWLLLAAHDSEAGWDFAQFYLAARLPIRDLYNREANLQLAGRLGISYAPPYVRPAVFALKLEPLGWLSYRRAFLLWATIQYACYLAALYLLYRIHAFRPEMLLAWALFYPAMFSIVRGQDANGVLLLVLLAFTQVRAERHRVAGILLSLCLYKFNLFVLLPLYLIARRRWQSLRWAMGGTAILVAASAWLQPPPLYADYLARIPEMSIHAGPEHLASLRGLTHPRTWLYALCTVIVVAAAWWAIRRASELTAFAVAITGSLLIGYHVAWYDLTLLAIPIIAALAAGWRPSQAATVFLFVTPLWLVPQRFHALGALLLFLALLASLRRNSAILNQKLGG